ncbi:MAG: delta-60 repeat domain-containing protein [Flavobacteriales bacterium]|nr:delta-60 repeat domain-containing protein [Flavobacteriales bacterium]
MQSDGKIIIGGSFTSYDGIGRNSIARLNADGSLDIGFNPGTGANNPVHSITLQPDGKIIIGGDFTNYNGTGRNRVARLNTDGSLDTASTPGSARTARYTLHYCKPTERSLPADPLPVTTVALATASPA